MQGRRGARQGGPRGRAQAWGEAYTRTHVRGMCEVLVTRYAELHAHSAFSFLDGANQPEELVVEASRLGLEALAITDHDGLYGVVRFAEEIGRASCRGRVQNWEVGGGGQQN